jgi:methylase of polypeptide subunit release factors
MSTQLLNNKKNHLEIEHYLFNLIASQITFENELKKELRQSSGIFFTNKFKTIDNILSIISIDDSLLSKKILEPSCGQGIFILKLLANIYTKFPYKEFINEFIRNSLIFVDINSEMVNRTELNIKRFYEFLFKENYENTFKGYTYDFTKKIVDQSYLLFQEKTPEHPLKNQLGKFDYVVGNPPYVTLYGRRDKKQNEQQRLYYLDNYKQFPSSVRNGKINLVMLFLENSLEFMKQDALLGFVIDISFFETAYLYTRKYLLEKTSILSLDINISDFDVASGQLILKLKKGNACKDHLVKIGNQENGNITYVRQSSWYNPADEYKFRINHTTEIENIIKKIEYKNDKTLKELYPKKNLRTCAMLLSLEDKFVFAANNLRSDIRSYPYYEGSKSLKEKYSELKYDRYFYYDKKLQDKINYELKMELEKKGIKNKKRVGFGEIEVYENPKVFIRQSAKEIIATYNECPGSANNSLYVFSLRNNSIEAKNFLKFFCGLLNSSLITFYAHKKNIIRYSKGKHPQIKISDLYLVRIPGDINIQRAISEFVEKIYVNKELSKELLRKIDCLIYDYYSITKNEIEIIEENIISF